MTRTFFLSAVLTSLLAMPALAGSPPAPSTSGPANLAAACETLGDGGESYANGGTTGCINTATGAALTCDADGTCTDHFADPRYAKIKAVLDAARGRDAKTPL
jgi:hypothetical protein